VVGGFAPSRSERRILRRNADLVAEERPPVATEEQFRLFHRYLASRHEEGGMVHMDRHAYGEMIGAAVPGTRLVEFRRPDRSLIGVSLTDRVRSGLSGVYKFYDPDEGRRSLGTFIILWHVARARELGLPYVYLGYWIEACRKMAYKSRFRPLERLDGDRWRAMAAPTADG
jgi:arginyl-tRNA--protein-N-Asp/Glu arginylyltransferase